MREDHTNPAPSDVVTTLCVIDTRTQTVRTLVSGADFYSTPRFAPGGAHLAWQQWRHPDMPWDGSEVHIARVSVDDDGALALSLSDAAHVAGEWKTRSAQYPVWAAPGTLLFTCDASGYQNPWTYDVQTGTAAPVLAAPVPEDFSLPMWQLGWAYGAPLDGQGKAALYTAMRGGRSVLYVVSLHSGALEEIECPYVSIEHVRAVTDDAVVFLGATADASETVVLCTIKDYAKPQFTALQPAAPDAGFPHALFAKPQSITLSIPPDGQPLHVIFYPPTNPDYVAPEGEKPPVVVNVHGGPTHHATQGFNLATQFFTSRGWAW